ncbi:hypothetical protein LUZ63_022042 [Rhynchospora breviuscula]|uniref:Cytochrome b n=1 Tax=Rhynchospora breviuscula TaxID=2022672 RepID=A0A9Q0BZ75_9POAL|nr:hypothetical protein LUZ63_022128 [Rhynchospora breviuscula]KAJ1682736.1 hypothetical protein LUZ63_022042 [Rhynchospora breviuscula]
MKFSYTAIADDITSGFKKPRELTWVTGVVLAVLTASFGVTGYSLPWDQIGYWAVKIVTGVPEAIPFTYFCVASSYCCIYVDALFNDTQDLRLAVLEPSMIGEPADPFATPLEILPEWYFFPVFQILRTVPNNSYNGFFNRYHSRALVRYWSHIAY